MGALKFDRIGYWSEVKLDIVREYARAYSVILSAQKWARGHVYVDAFAGPGLHYSKTQDTFVLGSPLNALLVEPPFTEFHLIDLDPQKVGFLKECVGDRSDVYVYEGDCNKILVDNVFPRIRYGEYIRGLCLLDPYGLHLNWEVIELAGKCRAVDMFLNFPVADMNRNVLWRDPEGVDPSDVARMTAFWGDESWKQAAYSKQPPDLFEYEAIEKNPNEAVAKAFQKRLKDVAGFPEVPAPMPMRNSVGAVIYYLFFASQKGVAKHIVEDIFEKHRNRGVS